jgi:hypothetical protein
MATTVLSYEDAKSRIVEALERDAAAQERGDYEALGNDFDSIAAAIPRDQPPRFNKILVALSFWDGWIHARDRAWKSHSKIQQAEWPVIAREVVQFLQSDAELNFSQASVFGLKPWRETKKWFEEYLRENPHLRDLLPPME